MPSAPRIRVARIGAPHGVRGEVKLWPYTSDPMAVATYGPLESEDGAARFEIESVRAARGHLVARLKGVNDRTAAEQLTNLALFVPRERLPAPDSGEEFYHADLIGLAVGDTAGAALGRVIAIHNFGAGDLVEIEPAQGTTVLLPFTAAAVPVVDIAAGRIVVDAATYRSAASPGEPDPGEHERCGA
ncbi:MAG: ribosome maturation factor RimM [Hyphomicrobiales bacterium]|nr:ribosome maturation factor RimM [Hyphomicrobiales bacterium]